jgi:acyl dehydratase
MNENTPLSTQADEQDLDEALREYMEELNARIGETKPVPQVPVTGWEFILAFRHVTEDMIRLFATVNGDMNPLWRDAEYARRSPWGGIIAPPLFVDTIASVAGLPAPPKMKGWRPYQGGSILRQYKPFRHGDVIDAEDIWRGIEEHSNPARPHRTFVLSGERRFRNQNGEIVCAILSRIPATVPRSGTGDYTASVPSGAGRERHRYSEEDLQEIYAHYDDELAGKLRRGAIPRYWEDVREGDDLGLTIKGPLDIEDLASYLGVSGAGLANASKWAAIRAMLDMAPRDPVTGAYHFPMDWHLDDYCAQQVGQPYAINFGSYMHLYCTHAINNWLGDHGWLREFDARINAPMFIGETMKITGEVVRTYEEGGRGLVDLALRGVEWNGLELMKVRAVVQLPHRGRPNEVVEDVLSASGAS